MLTIISYRVNSDLNLNEIPLHTYQTAEYKLVTMLNTGKEWRETEALLDCWWDCKMVQLLWKQFGSFSENKTQKYHKM